MLERTDCDLNDHCRYSNRKPSSSSSCGLDPYHGLVKLPKKLPNDCSGLHKNDCHDDDSCSWWKRKPSSSSSCGLRAGRKPADVPRGPFGSSIDVPRGPFGSSLRGVNGSGPFGSSLRGVNGGSGMYGGGLFGIRGGMNDSQNITNFKGNGLFGSKMGGMNDSLKSTNFTRNGVFGSKMGGMNNSLKSTYDTDSDDEGVVPPNPNNGFPAGLV
jgi:hypothetical protein